MLRKLKGLEGRRHDIPEVRNVVAVTSDDEFYLRALERLDPALVPPGLFRSVTAEAISAIGSGDLTGMVDGAAPRIPPASTSSLSDREREEVLHFVACANALDLLERMAVALPKQTSLRLGMLFLRVGVADYANRKITMTDIVKEDRRGFGPQRGWPDGKQSPTYVEKTVRNAYLGLESAKLLTTEQGSDGDGRNQYLRLTPKGRRVFKSLLSTLL